MPAPPTSRTIPQDDSRRLVELMSVAEGNDYAQPNAVLRA
jgi:hypothetical protein